MIAFNIILRGPISQSFKNKLQDMFQSEMLKGQVFGWCKIEQKSINLNIQGNDEYLSLLLNELQNYIKSEVGLSLVFSSVSLKDYKDFIVTSENLINHIKLDDYLDHLIFLAVEADSHLRRIMGEITKNLKYRSDFYESKKFELLIGNIPSKYLPEEIISKGDFAKYLHLLPSFSACLSEYTLHRKEYSNHRKYVVENIINNKIKAINFASKLEVPAPKIYQNNVQKKDLLLEKHNIVIKPMDGHTSKGVFIVKQENIYDVENRKEINLIQLESNIQQAKYNRWMVEQYIPGNENQPIPYDVKAFCFYGEVKLFLIIDRNHNTLKHEWLNDQFERVDVGRFNNSLFKSNFNNNRVLDYAKKLSISVPTPFLRIDFLASKDDLYFGEFTPRPGHFHEFNKTYDTLLGRSFIAAQARLLSDLMHGKEFVEFKSLL